VMAIMATVFKYGHWFSPYEDLQIRLK
jgi:hypothetical protein